MTSTTGWYQKQAGVHLMYDLSCLDDEKAAEIEKFVSYPFIDELFKIAPKVKQIVNEARLAKDKEWVSISADWWRRWAEATLFVDVPEQDVPTLPGHFSDLQPGYFMANEEDRKKLLIDYIVSLMDASELESYKKSSDKAKNKLLQEKFHIVPIEPTDELREEDELLRHVHIPLGAYKLLVPDSSQDALDIYIHQVVEVRGQRGVKLPESQSTMRLIVDAYKIRFNVRYSTTRDGKEVSMNDSFVCPSNARLSDAFKLIFERFGITDNLNQYVLMQTVSYYPDLSKMTDSQTVQIEYKYDDKAPGSHLWDTHIAAATDASEKLLVLVTRH